MAGKIEVYRDSKGLYRRRVRAVVSAVPVAEAGEALEAAEPAELSSPAVQAAEPAA